MRIATRILICASLSAGWVLYQSPAVERMVSEPDLGHSLSGGAQWLEIDEHPYIDYFVDFGPLFFYDSAAAQIMSGGRLIGEVALCAASLTIAYTLMFVLAAHLARGWIRAALLTATALFFFPDYFIYCFILGLMLVLSCAYLYTRHGGPVPLMLLAAAVAVCGLYRHDYGVYGFAGALMAVVLRTPRDLHKAYAVVRFAGLVLMFFMPWLIASVLSAEPLNYFEFIYRGSLSKASAFSLSHPLLDWRNESLTLLYAVFFSIPPIGLVLLFLSNRLHREKHEISADFAFATSVCFTGMITLIAASHRTDLSHLKYIVPLSLLCLAAIMGLTDVGWPLRYRPPVAALIGIGVAVPIIVGLVFYHLPRTRSLSDVTRSLSLMTLPRSDMLAHLSPKEGQNFLADLFANLRDCTPPDARILVFPYYGQAYYFAERPFAGKLLIAHAGYFSSTDFQVRQIEALRRQKPAIILWDTSVIFDRDPERMPIRTHSLIFEYVRSNYERKPDMDSFSVFVPKEDPEKSHELWRCVGSPRTRAGTAARFTRRAREAQVYQAVQPPSTTRFEPVMYDEASETRKITAAEYSSSRAMRPSGTRRR